MCVCKYVCIPTFILIVFCFNSVRRFGTPKSRSGRTPRPVAVPRLPLLVGGILERGRPCPWRGGAFFVLCYALVEVLVHELGWLSFDYIMEGLTVICQ